MSGQDFGVHIRPAQPGDLPAVYDLFYALEVGDDPDVPPRPAMLPDYPHLLVHGELYVAEAGSEIVGFAGVVARGETAYLTDLFVRPDRQSGRIGARLLRHALLPHTSRVRFTVSSNDPRALSLYIRAGMRPHWPNFLLRGHAPSLSGLLLGDVAAVEADPDDPELLAWDAAASGRERPQDHAYWVREEGAAPLWLRRSGETIGYGYVRLRAGTFYYPNAARVGPVGARSAALAPVCVAAAVRWAAERAAVLRLDVPGPHPALAPLLEAGFRIAYVETFVASAAVLFFDPQRYLGSGGSLF
ncbi:MAG TPA: GNAT family N-acetyltransferase [Roseiflexaceae bacterium]|nr:GNAT family N-acetyltransferase [Roseiflexaceae bacterium]